jgi:hypothetical protein
MRTGTFVWIRVSNLWPTDPPDFLLFIALEVGCSGLQFYGRAYNYRAQVLQSREDGRNGRSNWQFAHRISRIAIFGFGGMRVVAPADLSLKSEQSRRNGELR